MPAKTEPSSETVPTLSAATLAFDRGDFDRAALLAKAAIAAGAEGHALLGAALFKLGRLRESEAALAEALARDPENARLLRQLGQVRKLARVRAFADEGGR